MVNNENYRQLKNKGKHKCFGCSPINDSGLKMEFFTDEKSVFSHITVPEHMCGWNNLVHGGIISTILDEIMGWTAIYRLRSFILTKSIHIEFLKPITVGQNLKVEGKMIEIVSPREAQMEGLIYNKAKDLCARGTGTFAVFTLEAAKKLPVMNEELLKSIERFIEA